MASRLCSSSTSAAAGRGETPRHSVSRAAAKGDLLVLDNVLAAHGRMPFTGARRILLAMT